MGRERNKENNSIQNGLQKRNLGIRLTKDVKYLYSENYKTLKEKIEEGTRRQISHVHGLAESVFENDYTTESNLQIQCNPHQNPTVILHK
jgi:hypothetical protein